MDLVVAIRNQTRRWGRADDDDGDMFPTGVVPGVLGDPSRDAPALGILAHNDSSTSVRVPE